MTPYERINVMNKFLEGLEKNKIEIAKSIMWEIGKSWDDSLKEVVRTIGNCLFRLIDINKKLNIY